MSTTRRTISIVSPEVHSPKEYADVWKKIKDGIQRSYYDKAKRATDLKKFLGDTEPIALRSKTDAEFESTVKNMIKQFGDSHFDFYTRSDQTYYLFDSLARGEKAEQMPSIEAVYELKGDQWSVNMVLEGGAAEKAGIKDGDIVLTADGQPFSPVKSFVDKKTVSLEVKDGMGGKVRKIDVPVSTDNALDEFESASRESAKIINVGKFKFGYIHIWTLATNSFLSVMNGAVLGKLYPTDGMILDIRGGYGGRPEGYIDTFTRPAIDITWKGAGSGFTQHYGYSKPMVLLTDRLSRSAKEILSEEFKESKRATIVGQTTAGNVLGTTPFRVGDWCYLEMPIVDVIVNGHRLEKVGVSPDVKTPVGFDSSGKDITLGIAEKELEKKTGK